MDEQQTTQSNISISKQAIQSVLFYLAEPVSFKKLASIFEVETPTVENLVQELKQDLENTGLSLVTHDGEVQLVTHPDSHGAIEKIRKDELTKELTKPALETLSIVLYKDNISRADIDFIRGVNSSFILRNLLIRGLIVRKPHPSDSRTFIYTASHELLAYLGVSETKELPDFERIKNLLEEKVENLLSNQKESE